MSRAAFMLFILALLMLTTEIYQQPLCLFKLMGRMAKLFMRFLVYHVLRHLTTTITTITMKEVICIMTTATHQPTTSMYHGAPGRKTMASIVTTTTVTVTSMAIKSPDHG